MAQEQANPDEVNAPVRFSASLFPSRFDQLTEGENAGTPDPMLAGRARAGDQRREGCHPQPPAPAERHLR